MIRRFLSYMPQNVWELPPIQRCGDSVDRCEDALADIIPRASRQAYNMKKLIELVVDRGSMFEIQPTFGRALITADHGNVEQMLDEESGQPLTSHTSGPVPLVYVGSRDWTFTQEGSLSDIAPTLLKLMNIPVPTEMTGTPLMEPALESQLE